MIIHGKDRTANFFIKRDNGKIITSGKKKVFLGYKIFKNSKSSDEGVWVEWEWKDGRFELKADCFGYYPVYFFSMNNCFGVSTSIFDLLEEGGSFKFDDAALSVFLRLGYFIGDDTPFEQIRSIPPGCQLVWSNGELLINVNPSPIDNHKLNIPKKKAFELYGQIFQDEFENYLPNFESTIYLPLSGGRDSRHILFALLGAKRKPQKAFTVNHIPPKSIEDTLIAEQLCDYTKVKHETIFPSTNYFDLQHRNFILTNLCADEHAWMVSIVEHLKQLKNQSIVLFDGIAGDAMTDNALLDEKRIQLYYNLNFNELTESILGGEGYINSILTPKYQQKWNRQLAKKHLETELKKYINTNSPIRQFQFWNRTRREIALAPWGILAQEALVVAPYLNRRVINYLSSLPDYYFLDKKFRTEFLNHCYPQYNHLPYELKNKTDTIDSYQSIYKYAYDVAKYCFFCNFKKTSITKNYTFLLPRLLKGLMDRNYGTQLKNLVDRFIYLKLLELSKP